MPDNQPNQPTEAQDQTAQPETQTPDSHEAQYVTKEQLAATVQYLAAIVKGQQSKLEPKAEPNPSQAGQVTADELKAVQARLQAFEAKEVERQTVDGLKAGLSKAGLSPDAAEYLRVTWANQLRLGETGLYLDGGKPLSEAIAEFKASPLGARFAGSTSQPPVLPNQTGGKVSTGAAKPDALTLLQQAFGIR